MKTSLRWLQSLLIANLLSAAIASSALAWWRPSPQPQPPKPPTSPTLSTFTYLARIPSSDHSCEISAQELAGRVQQSSSNVVSAEGRCVARAAFSEKGMTYSIDTLEVTYRSIAPLSFVTEQLPTFEMSINPTVYPTYASCLADLANQSALFQRGTGLSVLTASCNPSGSDFRGYLLKIDGIGKAEKFLHTFKNDSYTSIQENAEWRQIVLDGIARIGGIVAKSNDETIAYYAERSTHFSTTTWMYTPVMDQCQAQLDEVRALLRRMGAKDVTATCHTDPLFKAVMNSAADIPSYWVGSTTYRYQIYNTFEECMAIRADALARDPAAKDWLGSFCVPRASDPTHYELKVYRY